MSLREALAKAFRKLYCTLDSIGCSMREAATSLIEQELMEEEHVFALITTSLFSGMPSPPTDIVLRLLPHMEREIALMTRKSEEFDDVFSQTLARFDI